LRSSLDLRSCQLRHFSFEQQEVTLGVIPDLEC
jgi:hypothetical protein